MMSLPPMTASPLVSIVTPSFNQGQFIEETIKSVLDQDYPHIEFLVMDGGSTDRTLDILKSYEGRLSYVSEPDRGQSEAINKGWTRTKGEILSWLNSDDTYSPGAIRQIVEAFDRHPEAGIIYGDCYRINAKGERIRYMRVPPVDLESLLCFTILQQPAVFIRRSVINEIGLLDTRLHFAMDHEYWIRAALRFPLVHIPEFLASSREHDSAKSTTGRSEFTKDAISILDQIFSNPEWTEKVAKHRSEAYAGAYLNSALWFCLDGDLPYARENVTKAVRLYPKLLIKELTLPILLESYTGIPMIRPLRWLKHQCIQTLLVLSGKK